MITEAQLAAVFITREGKANVAAWVTPLNAALETIEADRPSRAADFVAQWAHESAEFTRLEENLSYSANRLLEVFPYHPTRRAWGFVNIEDAKAYAGRQADTGNRVYGGRMGNREAGDGWLYRGRGLPMVTGRHNYYACSIALCGSGETLLASPELLCLPDYAMAAAAWYWAAHDLNQFSDTGNVDSLADIINIGRETTARGDANGFQDRLAYRRRARLAFGLRED